MENDSPSVNPNILSGLRQSRKKIGAGADPLDLEIAGYKGDLVARYKWVPMEQMASTAASLARIENPTQQQLAAIADALVQSCQEILVRVDGKLEPLSTNELPITYADGERLAYALDFPVPRSARECVFAVFSNDYALADHALRLTQWLEDTSRKVSLEQLGE